MILNKIQESNYLLGCMNEGQAFKGSQSWVQIQEFSVVLFKWYTHIFTILLCVKIYFRIRTILTKINWGKSLILALIRCGI